MTTENFDFNHIDFAEEQKMKALAKGIDLIFGSLSPVDPDNEERPETIKIPRKVYLEIDLHQLEKVNPELQKTLRQESQNEPEAAQDVEIADSLREAIASAIAERAKTNPQSICNLVKDVCIDWELTE